MNEHPPFEVVAHLLHGVYSDDQVRAASQHVLAGCSSCRALLDPRAAAILSGDPEPAVAAILRAHRRRQALLLEAVRRFAHQGAESVETAPRRLRGITGVVALLSLSSIARESAKSLQISYALFAGLLAHQLDPREHGERQVADFRCRAALDLAQGYCFAEQFERSDQAIGWAAAAFPQGFQRPRLKALLLTTWAIIDAAQGRPEKASRAIHAVLAIYQEIGDRDNHAITLGLMSLHQAFAGQPDEAVKLLREARLGLDEKRYPAIYLNTIHRQVKLLVLIGRLREARILLWTNLGRYAAYGGEKDQVERTALEGVINSGLGNLFAAERDLLDAALGFADLESAYNMALTSLDLAAVFRDQGRLDDSRECADIAIATFQVLEIAEEAHAALLVLKEAFARGLADSDLLRRTARYMRELSHTPEARFLPEH